jgi:hypothetical protein
MPPLPTVATHLSPNGSAGDGRVACESNEFTFIVSTSSSPPKRSGTSIIHRNTPSCHSHHLPAVPWMRAAWTIARTFNRLHRPSRLTSLKQAPLVTFNRSIMTTPNPALHPSHSTSNAAPPATKTSADAYAHAQKSVKKEKKEKKGGSESQLEVRQNLSPFHPPTWDHCSTANGSYSSPHSFLHLPSSSRPVMPSSTKPCRVTMNGYQVRRGYGDMTGQMPILTTLPPHRNRTT